MSDLKIYHIRVKRILPIETIGAYVITHTEDNIHAKKYVGATGDLYKRMNWHCGKGIIYIDVYIVDNIKFARSLEKILMYLIEPATNGCRSCLSNEEKRLMIELLKNNIDIIKYSLDIRIKVGCRCLKYIVGKHRHEYIEEKIVKHILKDEKVDIKEN